MELPAGFELTRGFRPRLDLSQIVGLSWDQPTIRIFGRERKIPRLTRWFGSRAYNYSGTANAPAPMPEWLEALARDVGEKSGARFNSALLNYYRDGRDSVSWHADDAGRHRGRPGAGLQDRQLQVCEVSAMDTKIETHIGDGPYRVVRTIDDKITVKEFETRKELVAHMVGAGFALAGLSSQPQFRGILGPMWDGDAIRYEDVKTYDTMST